MANHPAEQLRRDADRAELGRRAGWAAQALGRASGQRASDSRADQQRADDVRAAALVLLRASLSVLIATDRNVLGAVVGSHLRAAQRERSRSKRDRAGEQLLRE